VGSVPTPQNVASSATPSASADPPTSMVDSPDVNSLEIGVMQDSGVTLGSSAQLPLTKKQKRAQQQAVVASVTQQGVGSSYDQPFWFGRVAVGKQQAATRSKRDIDFPSPLYTQGVRLYNVRIPQSLVKDLGRLITYYKAVPVNPGQGFDFQFYTGVRTIGNSTTGILSEWKEGDYLVSRTSTMVLWVSSFTNPVGTTIRFSFPGTLSTVSSDPLAPPGSKIPRVPQVTHKRSIVEPGKELNDHEIAAIFDIQLSDVARFKTGGLASYLTKLPFRQVFEDVTPPPVQLKSVDTHNPLSLLSADSLQTLLPKWYEEVEVVMSADRCSAFNLDSPFCVAACICSDCWVKNGPILKILLSNCFFSRSTVPNIVAITGDHAGSVVRRLIKDANLLLYRLMLVSNVSDVALRTPWHAFNAGVLTTIPSELQVPPTCPYTTPLAGWVGNRFVYGVSIGPDFTGSPFPPSPFGPMEVEVWLPTPSPLHDFMRSSYFGINLCYFLDFHDSKTVLNVHGVHGLCLSYIARILRTPIIYADVVISPICRLGVSSNFTFNIDWWRLLIGAEVPSPREGFPTTTVPQTVPSLVTWLGKMNLDVGSFVLPEWVEDALPETKDLPPREKPVPEKLLNRAVKRAAKRALREQREQAQAGPAEGPDDGESDFKVVKASSFLKKGSQAPKPALSQPSKKLEAMRNAFEQKALASSDDSSSDEDEVPTVTEIPVTEVPAKPSTPTPSASGKKSVFIALADAGLPDPVMPTPVLDTDHDTFNKIMFTAFEIKGTHPIANLPILRYNSSSAYAQSVYTQDTWMFVSLIIFCLCPTGSIDPEVLNINFSFIKGNTMITSFAAWTFNGLFLLHWLATSQPNRGGLWKKFKTGAFKLSMASKIRESCKPLSFKPQFVVTPVFLLSSISADDPTFGFIWNPGKSSYSVEHAKFCLSFLGTSTGTIEALNSVPFAIGVMSFLLSKTGLANMCISRKGVMWLAKILIYLLKRGDPSPLESTATIYRTFVSKPREVVGLESALSVICQFFSTGFWSALCLNTTPGPTPHFVVINPIHKWPVVPSTKGIVYYASATIETVTYGFSTINMDAVVTSVKGYISRFSEGNFDINPATGGSRVSVAPVGDSDVKELFE